MADNKKFTKENYVILKRIHFTCVQWMRCHDMIFIFEKYESIYLSHKTKRFNMRATMKIDDVIIKSKIDIKMLKLQIDIKLKWHFHMKIIKIKMITQCMMLFKIMIFTWKMCFIKAKQICLIIIHSIMIYMLTIWQKFINKLNKSSKKNFFHHTKQMFAYSNKCF